MSFVFKRDSSKKSFRDQPPSHPGHPLSHGGLARAPEALLAKQGPGSDVFFSRFAVLRFCKTGEFWGFSKRPNGFLVVVFSAVISGLDSGLDRKLLPFWEGERVFTHWASSEWFHPFP